MDTTDRDTLAALWHALAEARSYYDPRLLAGAEDDLVRWYEPRLVDTGATPGSSAADVARACADLVRLIRSWAGTDAQAFAATIVRDIRLHLADPHAALAAGAPAAATTLADVMSAPAVTVQSWFRTTDAATILVDNGFTAAPVVDDGGVLIGIVTEADLLRGTVSGPSEGLDQPPTVGDVMTREVESLPSTASLGNAVELMLRKHVRSVPVCDGHRVVGVVTRRDLLRAAIAAAPDAPVPDAAIPEAGSPANIAADG